MTFAMVTTIIVTGGAILLGSAVIENVNQKGCGQAYDAWRSGDIYGDLADADNTEVLDQALDCQKSIHDAVQTAKPVATLISASGNIGGGADNFGTLIVDRTMDLTDNLSNPEHKHPIRDALLPPDITKHMDKKEEITDNSSSPEKTNTTNIDTTKSLPQNFIGTRTADFHHPNQKTFSEQGVEVTMDELSAGNLTFDFKADGSLTCSVSIEVNFSTNFVGQQTQTGSASAQSTKCTGTIDKEGIFIFSGILDGTIQTAGNNIKNSGAFSGSGFIDEYGSLLGDLQIGDKNEIPFEG